MKIKKNKENTTKDNSIQIIKMCGINTKGFQNISNILLQNNINEINVNNIERVMNFVGSIIKDIHI